MGTLCTYRYILCYYILFIVAQKCIKYVEIFLQMSKDSHETMELSLDYMKNSGLWLENLLRKKQNKTKKW